MISKVQPKAAVAPRHGNSTPDQLGKLAERRLRESLYHILRNVSVVFEGGVASLHGRVPSYYLKQMAQTIVGQIQGIDRVDNQIQVELATHHSHKAS
jgi:osmotically-inducible protein OsmY